MASRCPRRGIARARPGGRPSGLDRQLSCGWATDEDANAFKISTDYRGQHTANPVITGWKDLGFTARYARYDGFSLIALICAGYEKTIQKATWRSAEKRHFDYLNQLTVWGYTASAEEQTIIDKHTADTE